MGRKKLYASNAEKQRAYRKRKKGNITAKRNVTKRNVTKHSVTPPSQNQSLTLIDKHPSLRLQTAIMLLTDKFPRGNIHQLKTQLKTLVEEL